METKIFHYHKSGMGCKFLLAKLLIVVGLVLLGLNFNIIPQTFKPVIFSWQMLLLILGGCCFFYRNFLSGIIMILLGGFFIIPKLQDAMPEYFRRLPENFLETCYPFLLIAAGLMIIIYMLLPSKWKRCGVHFEKNFNTTKKTNKKGTFERNNIFSGGECIVMDKVFNGGEVNVIFGGSEIDLRHTTLPEGETFLEINGIFGGVQIFVPQTWNIELQTSNVFGGFSDTRLIDASKIDYSRKLVIESSFIFGGGEIKN